MKTLTSTKQKMLLVLIDEADNWGDQHLYEAIAEKLLQLEAPGATVQAGIMGFGTHHRLHRKGLFGVADDRPISICVVADEAFLREKIIPEVRPMVEEGLILLLDAEVLS
jgi:PII-like signaling protein